MLETTKMRLRKRSLYRWAEGALLPAGAITDAHLRAWEYEPTSEQRWEAGGEEWVDAVRLWRTRRPDLAPPELWVGDREFVADSEAH